MDNTVAYGIEKPSTQLLLIGGLHQFVGVLAGVGVLSPQPNVRPLLELFRSGFLGQAEADPYRLAMVWFFLFGFLLLYVGLLLRHLEAVHDRSTRGLAFGLFALCLLGVSLMPASGFWLGFVPAWFLWRQADSTETTNAHEDVARAV